MLRSGLISTVAALLTLAVGTCQPALADLSADVFIKQTYFIGGSPCTSSKSNSGTSQTATESCSGLVVGTNAPFVEVHGYASAAASYGAFEVNLNLDESETPWAGWTISGTADFSDSLTVLGYSGSGYVQYLLSVTGFPCGGGDCFDTLILNNTLSDNILLGGTGGGTSGLYGFTGGVPFALSLYLNVGAELSEEEIDEDLRVSIGQISLFDSNMQPLTNYELISASGTAYPAVGEVPEPSSAVLLLAVILGSVALRRRVPQ